MFVPAGLKRAQQDGAEDARGAPGKPFVHLVNGLERIALRHGETVDLDDGEIFFDGAFHEANAAAS